MKKIYVILSYTGTILSKIIKLKTGAEYTHASIALDENLRQMYSFGRVYPGIAFIGGFVRESRHFGTFKRFKNTQVCIYELEITDKKYEEVKELIFYMKKNKKKYRFNLLGLILAGINKKSTKENKFYCAEFVKYILQKANIDVSNLPEVIKPEDFKNLKKSNIIYVGYLRKYEVEKIDLINYIKTLTKNKEITV